MRDLNAKQKKMLKNWANKNNKNGVIIDAQDDIPIYWEVYNAGQEFENFNTVVENYIQDLDY